MEKLNAHKNVLTWFEIPVDDLQRAKTFYETILDIKMETLPSRGGDEETIFFPRIPDTIMALSGIVSGALVKGDRIKPGNHGALIYINAGPSIQLVIDKIENAGGKIIQPAVEIPAGFIAVFIDTEGNKIGIHSDAK